MFYCSTTKAARKIREAIDRGTAEMAQLVDSVERIGNVLERIERALRLPPTSPTTGFSLKFIREEKEGENMPTYSVYEATIPTPEPIPRNDDVVAGRIKIVLDGVNAPSQDTPKGGEGVTAEVKLLQGTLAARVGFVHVDDSGKESDTPLWLPEFSVQDEETPGSAVGGFGLTFKREVTE